MTTTNCFENVTYYNESTSWCPAIFDNYLCWPSTPPGQNVTLPCPQDKAVIDGGMAFRLCMEDGKWEGVNKTNGYTHYEVCILPEVLDLLIMCEEIQECHHIMRNTRNIEIVGLFFSLVSLIISLFIFFQYRVLKNNRTQIHKNLFIATLLQVALRLIKYVDQELAVKDGIIERTPGLNKTYIASLEYAKTAMFIWMFIEGLYLHNMITVTVFQEYSYIKLYFYVGWIAPFIMTAIWVLTIILVESNWGYYYFRPYFWILEGPRYTIIAINSLFLINIIRVLIMKLRESHTRNSPFEQFRKAGRAAIFLWPLMGIANVLFWVGYRFDEAWKLALWSYTTFFLNTFQGFFVALLYCFMNGEVQAAVKNSFYLHMSLRRNDYAPCRNLTLVSYLPEPEPTADKDASNWIHYCLKQIKKTSKKDINKCDLNGRRNSAIVTALTMVETKPFTREVDSFPRLSNAKTNTAIADDKSAE